MRATRFGLTLVGAGDGDGDGEALVHAEGQGAGAASAAIGESGGPVSVGTAAMTAQLQVPAQSLPRLRRRRWDDTFQNGQNTETEHTTITITHTPALFTKL